MPQKDVYICDSSNNPLKVKNIRIELFDAVTGKLLDSQNSADLNSLPGGPPSNDWGVRLSCPANKNPLDIYISDPTYSYPGNTVRYLNGLQNDRLDLDLLQLPSSPGGGGTPAAATAKSLARSVQESWGWTPQEKRAVRNLIFNYLSIIVPRLDELANLPDLQLVAENWEQALNRLGIEPAVLKEEKQQQQYFTRGV